MGSEMCIRDRCVEGKLRAAPHPPRARAATQTLERVHFDLHMMPVAAAGHSGARYALVVVDAYTTYCEVVLLRAKSDSAAALIEVSTRWQRQTGMQLRVVFSDRGGEFSCKPLRQHWASGGVEVQTTPPYTPQPGLAEVMGGVLGDRVRAMLAGAPQLGNCRWGDAMLLAAQLRNCMPRKEVPDGSTPYELFYGVDAPSLSVFHTFGGVCWAAVPNTTGRNALAPRAVRGRFLGFANPGRRFSGTKRVLLDSGRVVDTGTVVFSDHRPAGRGQRAQAGGAAALGVPAPGGGVEEDDDDPPSAGGRAAEEPVAAVEAAPVPVPAPAPEPEPEVPGELEPLEDIGELAPVLPVEPAPLAPRARTAEQLLARRPYVAQPAARQPDAMQEGRNAPRSSRNPNPNHGAHAARVAPRVTWAQPLTETRLLSLHPATSRASSVSFSSALTSRTTCGPLTVASSAPFNAPSSFLGSASFAPAAHAYDAGDVCIAAGGHRRGPHGGCGEVSVLHWQPVAPSAVFRVTSNKTRASRAFGNTFDVSPDDAVQGSKRVTLLAWDAVWRTHNEVMTAFVAEESQKPSKNQAFSIPVDLPADGQATSL